MPTWIADITRSGSTRFVALVAAGVAVLYARDPHSLLMPILYTEDGAWMARLFNRGFVDTFLFAKGGETPYFVFLNIVLLQAAKSLNGLAYGDSLARLPHFVSAIAMTFYAVLAAAPVMLLKPFLGPVARGLLWSLVILMPLGDSSFEVLGRLSNIGFGVLFLGFCLVAHRRAIAGTGRWSVAASDAGVFLCATTNPLCYPVIAADYTLRAWALWRTGASPTAALRAGFAPRSGLVLAVALAASVAGMSFLTPQPTPFLTADALRWNEVIEATVARPLLFPFVFPFYVRLNDAVALGLIVALGGLGWWLTRGSRTERLLFVVASAIGGYAAFATLAMRPGLTHFLKNYSTTFADRYYYGTSLFTVLAACASISAGFRATDHRRRVTAVAALAMIVAIYAGGLGLLIERGGPRWPYPPQHDFATAVAAAHAATTAANPAARRVRVDLHPPPWKARFPAENVRATAAAIAPDTVRR